MNLESKIIAFLALLIALVAGVALYGDHERAIGAAGVRAKWDAAIASAKVTSAKQTLDWTKQFSTIANHYQEQSHAQAPSIADTVATDVRGGTVRLRDEPAQACPGRVSDASSRSRAADAAAAAAATQRLADSVAAVRAGDAADAREQQLREQVIALQEILQAERER